MFNPAQILPTRDRVLLCVAPMQSKERQTASGIYLPTTDNARNDKLTIGTVVNYGAGEIMADGSLRRLDVSVGERVLFNADYATKLESESKTEDYHLLIEDRYIMARIPADR